MRGGAYFDSDVLIYTLAQDDPRQAAAARLLAAGGTISVQSLSEFAAVVRRKLHPSWPETIEALNAIRALCPPPMPVTPATHEAALRIADRLGHRIYDSLVIASALEAGCATLYSEDGQVIEGAPTIRDPFAP